MEYLHAMRALAGMLGMLKELGKRPEDVPIHVLVDTYKDINDGNIPCHCPIPDNQLARG